MIQPVDAHGETGGDFAIDVQRAAERVVGPAGQLRDREIIAELALLGLQPNRPAGGAPAHIGAGWALDDFDLFDRENLAAGNAGIAHSINIDVVARVEPADENPVAKGVAAFAGAQRHPRGNAHQLAKTGYAGVLHYFLGNDGDALGGVAHRFGKAAVGRFVDLVRGIGIGVGVRIGIAMADHRDILMASGAIILAGRLVRVGRCRDDRRRQNTGEKRARGRRGAQGGELRCGTRIFRHGTPYE